MFAVITPVQPVPIIMITARDKEVDRVVGLERADDYV
jgi:DNA-binding response OmpR family regulator